MAPRCSTLSLVTARSRDRLDVALDARRPRESCISGDQDDVQGFGQCDVRSVVGSHNTAQRPNAAQQWPVRRPAKWQVLKIRHCRLGSPSSHQPGRDMTAPHRRDLEIDEFRGSQCFVRQALPGTASVCTVVAQRYSQYARVNDDHVLPEGDSQLRQTSLCHRCVPQCARRPPPKLVDSHRRSDGSEGIPAATGVRVQRAPARPYECPLAHL